MTGRKKLFLCCFILRLKNDNLPSKRCTPSLSGESSGIYLLSYTVFNNNNIVSIISNELAYLSFVACFVDSHAWRNFIPSREIFNQSKALSKSRDAFQPIKLKLAVQGGLSRPMVKNKEKHTIFKSCLLPARMIKTKILS